MATDSDIGDRVRTLRQLRGLTLSELAERAKVNQATIWRIEAGKADPTVATLRRLALVLDIDVGALIE